MNAKLLQSPVRDAFFQTVRRVPAQQAYNGDSLRRVVLQRNALKATVDVHEHRAHRRKHVLESPPFMNDARPGTPAKDHSRYTSAKQQSYEAVQLPPYDAEAEDQWFEALFEELSLSDAQPLDTADMYALDPFDVPEAAMPQHAYQ